MVVLKVSNLVLVRDIAIECGGGLMVGISLEEKYLHALPNIGCVKLGIKSVPLLVSSPTCYTPPRFCS